MNRRRVRSGRVARLLLPILLVGGAAVAGERPTRLDIDLAPHGTILWERGRTPVLRVKPRRGDGWISIARRYTGVSSTASGIRKANPGLRAPMVDRRLSIPVELLRADLREASVKRLFPIDRRLERGLEHFVLDPYGEGSETWRWLAGLFAEPGTDPASIRSANPHVAGSAPRRAESVVIPRASLLQVFRAWPLVRPLPTPTPKPAPVAVRPTGSEGPELSLSRPASGLLSFGVDHVGEFGLYRLKRGEALYSAVVVRFTGQLHAIQVNETASEIARRSGIDDVTDIPVGYSIKIPIDLILPEYLPPDHPRRKMWEREQAELGSFLEVVRATDLSGVHVILDAGHGGRDTGAVVDGVWESTYVYDLLCRVKEHLTRHTKATVWTTIKDRSRGYDIPDRDRLRQDRDQMLLTRPEHGLDDSVVGVHLRWYLSNDIIVERIPKHIPRAKVVFVSIHADSLHASVRGSMVYVPSRYLRRKSYQASSRDLRKHQEYQNHPKYSFSGTFNAKAEASSRHLAVSIIESLRRNDLEVHPNKPIRDRVRRGRRTWVPAVLRYSQAQNAVLVECANMANAEDRANLTSREWRDAFARALVEGIASAFNAN